MQTCRFIFSSQNPVCMVNQSIQKGHAELTGSAPPFLSSTSHEWYDRKAGQKHHLSTQTSTGIHETESVTGQH